MADVLSIILGILKFWNEVVWFIRQLQSIPPEELEKRMAAIRAATVHVAETEGDTSGYEKILRD